MNFNNSDLNMNEGFPILPEIIPLENIDLFLSYHDIALTIRSPNYQLT